jgi:hypothetical protein
MQLAYYRRSDDHLTTYLEREAQDIRQVIQGTAQPSVGDLKRIQEFLIDIEKWKADCMEERTGNAVRNPPMQIWASLQRAINAVNDVDALLSIMNLIGFGSAIDENTGQRRAKRATAVMRFLNPNEWGTVDWRTIAMLSFYKKNDSNMDFALKEAKKHNMRTVASDLDCVDENMAIGIVQEYRNMRDQQLPRTVDVELALYGASFLAWPRPKQH